MSIPGVGPLLASALVATVADPKAFKSGRNLAAWIGLVPKQNSSGGKERFGGITKQGDRYLRQLLVVGALAVVRYAERHGTRRPWLVQFLAQRPTKVATVALANKIARMAWAIMTSGESYREPELRGRVDQALRRRQAWEGHDGLTHPAGRYRRTGKPTCAIAPSSACYWSGPDPRGRHYGQRLMCAASTGRTHGRTDQLCRSPTKPLPKESRPHMALCERRRCDASLHHCNPAPKRDPTSNGI